MKLLLVEDNPQVAQRVKRHLVSQRYVVDLVASGEEALVLVDGFEYGAIILDLGLPVMPGDVVCKKMRDAGIQTPILILTGTAGVKHKVRLLDSGADDYVTKPFDSEELTARIGALTRRQPTPRNRALIKFPGLVIDTERRTAIRDGVHIALRPKEFDILVYLVQHNGQIVTRNMIIQNVWNTDKETDTNAVDVHVKHLRDQIDRPFPTHIIKTEYGLGYRVDIPTE